MDLMSITLVVRWLIGWGLMWRLPRLPDLSVVGSPKVSVLIPARNEEDEAIVGVLNSYLENNELFGNMMEGGNEEEEEEELPHYPHRRAKFAYRWIIQESSLSVWSAKRSDYMVGNFVITQ